MVLSFHELAEHELNDAAQYYDREQAGLGAAFIADVRRCTVAILEFPEAGPVIRGYVRRACVGSFDTECSTRSGPELFEFWPL